MSGNMYNFLEEVFVDTQPLIRSVLNGYDVCIFAYGQTGLGKTYTVMGPNVSSPNVLSPEDWGVNYRALNDLFHLSQITRSSEQYEISVQFVEIYNEKVHDLLSSNNETLEISSAEARMHRVTSTAEVLELMNLGMTKRVVGATTLNERSSRSHSILNIHIRGTDRSTNGVWHGNLNLIDLAGSERVSKSEATGVRLEEAKYINKSLSALQDVIHALALKAPFVPYRNSKLTQVLQKSLEGRAKTIMFVHVNPDVESYSETKSTLEFAERASGVELGAHQSNKEGIGVRHVREQVTSPSWSSRQTVGKFHNGTRPHGKSVGLDGPKDIENCSEFFERSKLVTEDGQDDIGLGLSMGTTILSPETTKAPTEHQEKSNLPSKLPRPPPKTASSIRNQVQPQWHKQGTPSRPAVTKVVPSSSSRLTASTKNKLISEGKLSKHGKPNENSPAEWLRNVVLPNGGDSVVASLAAAPVVKQPVEGTEGGKVDGEKKKKKKQNGIEEAEVIDTPVASKKHKAEEVKDDVEGESTEKKKEAEKKKKKKDKENGDAPITL